MKLRTNFQLAALFAALLLASASSAAQSGATLTPTLTPAGISYISGGVGDAQQQAMKEAMKDYNLRLTFAQQQTGAYLAGVKVTIDQMDAGKGGTQVLGVTSGGPMLFARLPAGKYQVRAEVDGQVQARAVDIGTQAQDVVLYFATQ